MRFIFKAIRNSFSLGRACRSEFWHFHIFAMVIGVLAEIWHLQTGGFIRYMWVLGKYAYLVNVAYWGLFLFLFVSSITVTVRRLHDAGYSGWRVIKTFIPGLGMVFFFFYMTKGGQADVNRYGPNPRGLAGVR
jgi:uncharacterized membrane protein YhaH (DUF805 family)